MGGNSSRKTILLGSAALGWMLLVLLGYSYTHKPFSPLQFLLALRALWRIFLLGAVFSVAGGIGARIFPRGKQQSPLLFAFVQGALGLGVLGLLIFFLGLVGGFHPLFFAGIFAGLGALTFPSMRKWWGAWKGVAAEGRFEKILAGGAFFLAALSLLTALAPPLQFDALVYHLTLPKAYLQAGRIIYVPQLMFSGMPQLIEMLYAAVMALWGGAEAAAVLGWGIGVFALMGLWAFLHLRFGTRAAWAAVAATLAGFTFADALSWAYVDWATFLWGIAILIALDFWAETEKKKYLFLTGAFAGFAFGTKYTAGIAVLFAFVAVAWISFRRGGARRSLKDLAHFSLLAALVAAPWALKNLLWTGNPIYPLLFPSGAMDSWRLAYYNGGAPWGSWQGLLIFPWQVTIWGVDGKVGPSASIGALLLGFSVWAWNGWGARAAAQRRTIVLAAGFTLLGFLIWAAASRFSDLLSQTRLYWTFFPAWAILAGVGFDSLASLEEAQIRFGRILAILFLLAFGFTIFQETDVFVTRGVSSYLMGHLSEEAYLRGNLGAYADAMQAVDSLPSGSKVLMLWETRSFTCFPRCEPDEIIDRWFHDRRVYNSPEEIVAFWRNEGYDYLLLSRFGAAFVRENDERFTEQDWDTLDALLRSLPLENDIGGAYEIYRLSP